MWIGTLDGGLNHLEWINRNSDEYQFRRFTRKDGLLSDTVYGLERDGGGSLWLSSARGLTRFDPLTKAVRHFDRSSGLRDNEFNFGAHFQDRAGRLYFGGPQGMVEFDPDRLTKNAHRPPVVVKADIGGEIIAVGHSDDSAPVKATLDYRERRVTFRFAALDFASPSKNIYRYRLGGFEDVWRDSGEYPQATYTNLPAGSYTFEAMAANNDGLASERPAQIELHVAPAPWRTGWAYVSYGAFLGAVILAIWRHQRRKVRMAAEQRRELSRKVDERTRDLKKANVELETVNAKLVEASVTDSLTGLKNRRYLDTVIEDRISAIDRRCNEHGAPPSPQIAFDISPRMFFMMIDLDGFKDINDDHGHHAGDQAIDRQVMLAVLFRRGQELIQRDKNHDPAHRGEDVGNGNRGETFNARRHFEPGTRCGFHTAFGPTALKRLPLPVAGRPALLVEREVGAPCVFDPTLHQIESSDIAVGERIVEANMPPDEEMERLEQELEAAGAPWTPGRRIGGR